MEIIHNKTIYKIDDTIKTEKGSYEPGECLGSGGNSTVYECLDLEGKSFAIKFLFSQSEKMIKRFNQEIELLQKIDNPYIIRYIDNGTIQGRDKNNNNNKVNIPFIIMEKADRDLLSYVKGLDLIPYNMYSAQFRGLCNALAELHKYAIHRDIKPENILIKGERWVLSDFGLCDYINSGQQLDITNENEKIGPQFWMSPEAINKVYFGCDTKSKINTASDVYQLCMIFIFVLNRDFPGGILTDEDINCQSTELKTLLLNGISNRNSKRPKDGAALLERFNEIFPEVSE